MEVRVSISVKASSREAYGPGATLIMAERIRRSGSMMNRGPACFVICPTGRPSRSVKVQVCQSCSARATVTSTASPPKDKRHEACGHTEGSQHACVTLRRWADDPGDLQLS